MDRLTLKKAIEPLRYGQFNLLETPPKIYFERMGNRFVLTQFYHHDEYRDYGTCMELTLAAHRRISDEFPGTPIMMANGNDNRYFVGTEDSHWFLLVPPEPYNGVAYGVTADSQVLSQHNPILVDPSFHRAAYWNDLTYRVKRIDTKENCRVSDDRILPEGDAVPLMINKKGEILYLVADACPTPTLAFAYTPSSSISVNFWSSV